MADDSHAITAELVVESDINDEVTVAAEVDVLEHRAPPAQSSCSASSPRVVWGAVLESSSFNPHVQVTTAGQVSVDRVFVAGTNLLVLCRIWCARGPKGCLGGGGRRKGRASSKRAARRRGRRGAARSPGRRPRTHAAGTVFRAWALLRRGPVSAVFATVRTMQ